jgi:hypothetical protein
MLNSKDVIPLACRKLVFRLVQHLFGAGLIQHLAEISKQACPVKILNQVQNDICGVRDDKKSVLFKDDECFYYFILEIEAQVLTPLEKRFIWIDMEIILVVGHGNYTRNFAKIL